MKQKELIQRKLGLEGIEGNLERNFLSHVSVELLLGKLLLFINKYKHNYIFDK